MLKKSAVISVCLASVLNAGMFDSLVGAVAGSGGSSGASAVGALMGGGSSTPAAASSGGGLFGSLLGGSSKPVTANDISGVVKTFQEAEAGLNNSVDLINQALGDKDKLAEWAQKEKTIKKMPESSEKDAAIKALNEDQLSYATKLAESEGLSEKAKKLNAKQKEKVGTAIGNLLLVVLKDQQALSQGKNVISSLTTNPALAVQFASDLPKIKDVIVTIPTQLSSLGTLSSGLISMAKEADINVKQPASADEKLKPVSF